MPKPTQGLSAEHLKFNLQAGVSVPGGLPAARERLLRYCARPPLALERLSVLDDGKICYRVKDTDQVRLMTPVQFLARLAALVPLPRHPLVRFYGVWAPHSQWRSRVVTAAPATRVTCATSTATGPRATPVTPAGLSIIDASGTAASPPTPDGAQATSVPHASSPKPLLPSAAALPRAEEEPLAPSHPQARNCGSADSLAWPGLRCISESSTSTRSSARAAADGCVSSK